MRVLVLHTFTDCENKIRSVEAAGHGVLAMQYDDRPHERHGELVADVENARPDVIVMIGAVEQYHGRPVLRSDTLRAMRRTAPTVLMCNDAADPPWWQPLDEYQANGAFDLFVSIDGNPESPIGDYKNGLTLLTPIDHRPFKSTPWHDRQIDIGMVGGEGHTERQAMTNELRQRGLLYFLQGPGGRSYDEMAAVMCNTRVTYNYGMTGSRERMHVKGRVVESGFAGSALLEKSGSPTAKWFVPGIDFIEFDTADDVEKLVRNTTDQEWHEMADRLRVKVTTRHHPAVFWQTVFDKLGELHGYR